ncbi:uncharacterized protein LOC130669847 [Microplitis mediator]|uniref:uncharacterized protein LOC130669847 n=1 Tax=Microplitis mediator TaxID=375433 RepID=UPI002553DB8D|nr:uncharacterized protein LOC130669847 [Microplitis mediator]
MSYSGNLPDWHQYNPPQHGRTGSSSSQNANPNHIFHSSINPPALDSINLSTNERQSKHHRNDVNYSRNYASTAMAGPSCATNSNTGVHMGLSGCVGHYGSSPSRNPMMEGMPGSMDPRLAPVGPLNEPELPHRNNQMPFNPPNNHSSGSNISNIHSSMAPQTSPVGPMSPGGRQGPPFGTCKGPCCNPDTSIAYQHWEKYGHYPANAAYRDNMRSAGYHMENRRFVPDMNLRKDCIENKELPPAPFPVDNRRNYPEYKYRKELSRNYPSSSLIQNYNPMQNYNFTSECQKCPHSVKEYLRRSGPNSQANHSQNQGIIKYPEQQSVIVQQKYNNKQMSYQNGALGTNSMPTSSASNLPSSIQNSYFNPQLPRDMARDFPREFPDPNAVGTRLPTSPSALHGPYQKYHAYQQKLSMQRFSIESHLRAMTRVPGYQSHPKYQEYLMRYREILRLQQNADYQGMLQETSKLPSPSSGPPQIPPINLQFDQNGVLINTNYNPGHFPGILNPVNPIGTSENTDNTDNNNQTNVIRNPMDQQQNNYNKITEQSLNLSRNRDNLHNQENYMMQKNDATDFDNLIVNVDDLDMSPPIRTSAGDTLRTTTSMPTIDNQNSKEFTDKPALDVRQFLANWDETEEEEATAANLSQAGMNNIASVVAARRASVSPPKQIINEDNRESQQNKINNVDKITEQATIIDANLIVQNNVDNINVTGLKTIEELANSGTIVQCIQSDSDDIPTIHIVDHLPNESELTTIQTVYSDVSSLTMEQIAKAPIEIINETPEGTETITLYEPGSDVCTKITECNDTTKEAGGVIVVDQVVASIIDASVEIVEATTETANDNNSRDKTLQVNYEKSSSQTDNTDKNTNNDNNNKNKNTNDNDNNNSNDNNNDRQIKVINESSKINPPNNDSNNSLNLKKQHSFASEESHNPDDISLPDLPMSECTPISTTLNTPIHSDSEESPEHVTDLSISTNPIEVIQNSPIISFSHSPIKIDPYGNLENGRLNEKPPEDSLDFDFNEQDNLKNKFNDSNSSVNNKNNNDNDSNKKTAVEDFEIARRSSTSASNTTNVSAIISISNDNNAHSPNKLELEDHHKQVPLNLISMDKNKSPEKDKEFYPSSDPLVGMTQSSDSISKNNLETSDTIGDISNDMIQSGDCSGESLGANTILGNSVSRILSSDEIDTGKCPSIINTEDFQQSDELDKLCNMSLDDSCMMPLISDDNSRLARMPMTSIEDRSLTKVMTNILPISDINVLESSDDDNDDEQLDKEDDDWIEVKSLDGHENLTVNLSTNEMVHSDKNSTENLLSNLQIHSNESDKKTHGNYDDVIQINKYNKSCSATTDTANTSAEYNSKCDNYLNNDKSRGEDKKNYIPSIFDISGESQSTDFDKFERRRQEKNNDRLKSLREYRRDKSVEKLSLGKNDSNDYDCSQEDNSLSDDSTIKTKTIQVRGIILQNNDNNDNADNNERNKKFNNNNNNKQQMDEMSGVQSDKSFETISNAFRSLETHTVTKCFRGGHKDTDVQIHVANINVKEKSDDEASEAIDAIEIKINVSRSDKNRGNKQLNDKLTDSVNEICRNNKIRGFFSFPERETTNYSPKSIFNYRRRKSVPDEFDTRKSKFHSEKFYRRHSGGHSFKSYRRKSNEDKHFIDNNKKVNYYENLNSTNSNNNSRNFESTLMQDRKIIDKDNDDSFNYNVNLNQMSRQSHDDLQETLKNNTNNILDIIPEDTKEDENSESAGDLNKSKDAPRRLSVDTTLNTCRINDLDNIVSRSPCDMTPGPSDTTLINNIWNKSNFLIDNTSSFDFDNFDVAPNYSSNNNNNNNNNENDNNSQTRYSLIDDEDGISSRMDAEVRNRRLEDSERYRNPYSNVRQSSPDSLGINLNTVPVYTTKDGKITYSPNPRYTYRVLLMEARQREGYPMIKDLYQPRAQSKDYQEKRWNKRKYEPTDRDKYLDTGKRTKSMTCKLGSGRWGDSHHERQFKINNRVVNNKYECRSRDRVDDYDDFIGDQSTIFTEISTPLNYSPSDSTFSYDHHRHSQSMMYTSRRSEDFYHEDASNFKRRHDGNLEWDRAIDLPSGSSINHINYDNKIISNDNFEGNRGVESKISNGEELELFSKNLTQVHHDCHDQDVTDTSMSTIVKSNVIPSKEIRSVDERREITAREKNKMTPDSLDPEASNDDDDDFKDIGGNSIMMMKPPASVDTEQDSQAMLTDSGLESSTTYTEGSKSSKEPKRCQRWPKKLLHHVEKVDNIKESKNDNNIFESIVDLNVNDDIVLPVTNSDNNVNNNVDKVDDINKDNAKLFVENEGEEMREEEEEEEVEVEEEEEIEDKNHEIRMEEEIKVQENINKTIPNITNIEKLTNFMLLIKNNKNYDSSMLKGLDLAFPSHKVTRKLNCQIKINNEAAVNDNDKDEPNNKNDNKLKELPASLSSSVCTKQMSNFIGLKKLNDGTILRRISSDEVESRKRDNNMSIYYEDISSYTGAGTSLSTATDAIADRNIIGYRKFNVKMASDKLVDVQTDREADTCDDMLPNDTAICLSLKDLSVNDNRHKDNDEDDDVFEKPSVPPVVFGPLNNPNLIKTHEPDSEISIESEVSNYIDTRSSTQFGSDCAESKQESDDFSNNGGINFLSTSSQEAIDATDLNDVRKSLVLSGLKNDNCETREQQETFDKLNDLSKVDDDNNDNDEDDDDIEVNVVDDKTEDDNKNNKCDINDKLLSFSGRISSESEDDSNAQDASPLQSDKVENLNVNEKEKEKILSFTGRIDSPENHIDIKQNSPVIFFDDKLEDKNNKDNNLKVLNFSGRIPSPKYHFDTFSIHQSNELTEDLNTSSNINENTDKNLTFLGKITSDVSGKLLDSSKKPSTTIVSDKIPKFIIKKTDYSSKSSSTISQILPPSDISSLKSIDTKASSSHKISSHPKIPKMIIRNLKSRPGTPTVEENAVELSFPKAHEDQKIFQVKIKLDDKKHHESRKDSVKKSIGIIECKVPKMKIKLDDCQPKMIFENASMELYDNDSESTKNVPKVKIRKIKRSTSREGKSSSSKTTKKSEHSERSDRSEKSERTSGSSKPDKSGEKHRVGDSSRDVNIEERHEKIPKLKIKKSESRVSQSSHDSKKKRSKSPTDTSSLSQKSHQKKSSSRHRSETKQPSERSPSVDKEGNTNSHTSMSEKIPKVIIKRASSSAEFKCELSKDGGDAIKLDSKWQPEVKLERFKVLDTMAKESSHVKIPVNMLQVLTMTDISHVSTCSKRDRWTRTSSDPSDKIHLSSDRSISKGKRRHSDSGRSGKGSSSSSYHSHSHSYSHTHGHGHGHGHEKKSNVRRNSTRSLNDDSDTEDFPRIIRRDGPKRLNDESSQDESLDTKLTAFTDSSENHHQHQQQQQQQQNQDRNQKEKAAVVELTTPTIATTTSAETMSEFEFSATSCSKKINDLITEPTVTTLASERDVTVDVVNKNIDDVDVGENYEVPESVIKLESSDESQTTIEILPASPEVSQPESEVPMPLEGKRRIANGDMAQLYSEDAIPTQFELELEIVDNSSESLEVPVPEITSSIVDNYCSPSYAESVSTAVGDGDNNKDRWKSRSDNIVDNTGDGGSTSMAINYHHKCDVPSEINICCSDSLVKEVLAAKETLKRCLAKTKSEYKNSSSSTNNNNSNSDNNNNSNRSSSKVKLLSSRPKTAAEKKQGAGFDVTKSSSSRKDEIKTDKNRVFQESGVSCDVSRKDSTKSHHEEVDRKHEGSNRKHEERSDRKHESSDRKHSKSKRTSSSDRREKRSKIESESCSSSSKKHEETSVSVTAARDSTLLVNDTIKSLKRSRESNDLSESSNSTSKKIKSSSSSHSAESSSSRSKASSSSLSSSSSTLSSSSSSSSSKKHNYESGRSKDSENRQPCPSPSTDSSSKVCNYKIPKIPKQHHHQQQQHHQHQQELKTTTTEVTKNVTEIMPTLEPADQVNFDLNERDTSRSPPEITKQDSTELNPDSPKKVDDKKSEKDDSVIHQDSEAVTFADIVAQMAYHEKATIKHKRYCILCERWFPTTERHRRHLTGYQHRHTELTQRRTVHALFMLFTGKPCPRLLPASIVRTDCVPGEPTPLQIAVQDVAISLEKGASNKNKTINEDNKS